MATAPDVIEIRFGRRRWAMTVGSELTFGRGADRDIRIGHDPEDIGVSRNAGVLLAGDGGLLVRNDSGRQRYQLLPLPGRSVRIDPGMTVGVPDLLCHLHVFGQHGALYELVLDRRRPSGTPHRPTAIPAAGRPTEGPPPITPAERRMLIELCRPLLLYAGDDAAPAAHREIAEILGVRTDTVRRTLAALRARLSGHGVPGLSVEDGAEARTFSDALADWAIRSGVVSPASLDDPGDPDR